MRTLSALFIAALLSATARAQNPAPVQQDTQTHVTPAQHAAAAGSAQKASAAQKGETGAPENKPIVLDSVIAIINGSVLLESDVEEERRFESLQLLPTDENTDARAAEHLITRTLILQQMKEEDQSTPNISDADVNKFIAELKKQLPGCLPTRCQTDAGWAGYLADRGMTPSEVKQRWRQRLVILNYLNLRFRSGVRVPTSDIQAYYDKNLLPEFQAKHERPPTLKTLQPRIEEILLQQQVTKQVGEWEATLRQQGSVQILVPAYGQSNDQSDDDMPGGL